MSCIIASITRADSVDVSLYRNSAEAQVQRVSSVEGSISRGAAIVATVKREAIEASINRVCRFGLGDILVVSPEVVWLTPDNDFSADFEVVATVDWNVEY